MPDIFLSYSREDQATARQFAEALQRAGFEVWWDQTLRSGEAYDEVTENALKSAQAVVVLWSKTAVASRWVRAEATIADRKGNLVPAMIEPCERPVMFELRQTAELAHWQGDAQDRAWLAFVDDLRQKVGGRPAAPAQAVAGSAAQGKKPLLRQPNVVLAVVALLALIGVFAIYQMTHKVAVPTAAPVAAAAPIQVAILPFESFSTDPKEIRFARTLAGDFATQLQQVGPEKLRVFGLESTEPLQELKRDPREIARALGADYLLRAEVQSEGSDVHVTVRLLGGLDAAHVGPPLSYRRKRQDILTLQQEIATDVARKVGIVLDITLPRAQGGTNSVEAVEHYERALEYWRRGEGSVIASLGEAVKEDGEYRQAWYLLYIFLFANTLDLEPGAMEERRQERDRAAARLRELPPDSFLFTRFQALRATERHDWAAALSHAEAAVEMSPVRDSLYAKAQYLLMLGRVSDAIPLLKQTRDSEPLNQEVTQFLQWALLALGRDAEARAEAARIRALGIEFTTTPPYAGDRAAINNAVLTLYSRRADGRFANGPLAGELPGILQDEGALEQKLLSGSAPSIRAAYNQAVLAVVLGMKDERLHPAIRDAMVKSPEGVFLLRYLWITGAAAQMPREMLKSLVRELKLDEYWRKSDKWSDFCHATTGDDFECFEKPVSPGTETGR